MKGQVKGQVKGQEVREGAGGLIREAPLRATPPACVHIDHVFIKVSIKEFPQDPALLCDLTRDTVGLIKQ